MKKKNLLFVCTIFLLFLLLVFGLPKYIFGKKIGLNQNFTLVLNQTEQVLDYKIKLMKIEDNRCPSKVACFRAGEIIYTLNINNKEYMIASRDEILSTSQKLDNYILAYVEGTTEKVTLVLRK